MNWYKHHIGDYAKDTAHLSILEHGVYLLMLHHHYATEAPLPADQAVICRIIRAISKAEAAAVAEILRQFWILTEFGWVNDRASEEIERAAAQRDTNRELGKRGGRPMKTESVSESEPNGKPNRNPPQTPDTSNQITSVSELGKGGGNGSHRQSAADRHRNAVAIADAYAETALAAGLESGILGADAGTVSPSVDIAVVEPGRIRAAAR